MDHEPPSVEHLVHWLEARGLLWPVQVFLLVTALTGANAIVHDRPGEGLVFGIVSVLVVLGGARHAEAFFGASSLALLIVIHIALVGVNPVALVFSFAVFMLARGWIGRSILGPIALYLLLDTTSAALRLDELVLEYLAAWGRQIFASGPFYFLLSLIPATWAVLELERWGRRRFRSGVLKEEFATLASAGLFIVLATGTLLTESSWLAYPLAAAAALYLFGAVLGFMASRESGRRSWRFSMATNLIVLIVLLALSLLKEWPSIKEQVRQEVERYQIEDFPLRR